MADEIVIKEIEVTKLRLRPGDVILVKLPTDTKHSWMQKLALHLTKVLPRNPALLIANNDVQVSVLTPEDAKALVQDITGKADEQRD
jgi:hypothetical protein